MTEAPPRARRPMARLRGLQAGFIVLVLCLLGAAVLVLHPDGLRKLQEPVFDALVQWGPKRAPSATPVVVVDIGATDEKGLPWDRTASARLALALARLQPKAVGWDIVFAGNCVNDGPNAALRAGLEQAPTTLGFLMSREDTAPPQPMPSLAAAEGVLAQIWSAPGAEVPCPLFTVGGSTLGSTSLPGDDTARVRMVPAAVNIAGTAYPALPVEMLRRAGVLTMAVLTLDHESRVTLRVMDRFFPLDMAGTLRFVPQSLTVRRSRTLSAESILSGQVPAERLKGGLVLVGSSLPQRGGLRPTAIDPLYPSVQIAADVAEGLAAGQLPWRPGHAAATEGAALALGGLLLVLAMLRLPAMLGFGVALGLGLIWAGGAVALHTATAQIYDPVFPALGLVGAALAGLVARGAASARAERALRQRMGQLMPAEVLTRLCEDPGLLRLRGERREVTALFTDLEGFSTLTNTLPPEELIAILDRYFAVVTKAVLDNGGMIDKIVGDAVHALFNAPIDQIAHVNAALRAASAIVVATESLRPALGIGRTRLGVETGPAILGDVGTGARIDYTAHGPVVNLAARLQDMGKELGPSVIIGPAAAAQSSLALRPLGAVTVRSFGTLNLFTLN